LSQYPKNLYKKTTAAKANTLFSIWTKGSRKNLTKNTAEILVSCSYTYLAGTLLLQTRKNKDITTISPAGKRDTTVHTKPGIFIKEGGVKKILFKLPRL
jgi:hypothetical protein